MILPWRRTLVGAVMGLAAFLSSTAARADGFAILFSGGVSIGENKDYYYGETVRMYNNLLDLGYKAANIYIVFADGLDPAHDQTQWDDSDVTRNSDWSFLEYTGTTVLAATAANVQSALQTVADRSQVADTFVLWTFDHGGDAAGSDPNDHDGEWLSCWNGPGVADEVLPLWCDPIPTDRQAYIFGQCFSGGMLEEFHIQNTAEDRRFGCASARHYEVSYEYPDLLQGFMEAFNDTLEYEHLTNTVELAMWAIAENDGDNHPEWHGDDFSLAICHWKGSGAGGTETFWREQSGWTRFPDHEHQSATEVNFSSSGTLTVDSSAIAEHLTVDYSSTFWASARVRIVDGARLYTWAEVIADENCAVVSQEGGEHTVFGDLYLAWGDDTHGTYEISNGTLTAERIIVGRYGLGRVTQTGGTVVASEAVSIADLRPHAYVSCYELQAGTLDTGELSVGTGGIGYVQQTGGTVTVLYSLYVGKQEEGFGTYDISTGASLDATQMYVGYYGRGEFNQSGGNVTVAEKVTLGYAASGVPENIGSYTVNGGILDTPALTVGRLGTGQFTQHAGLVNVDDLVLGEWNTGDGTYLLDGGTLIVANRLRVGVAGFAHFTWAGGTLDAGRIEVGNGGALEVVKSSEWVNNGTLIVTGGVVTLRGGAPPPALIIGRSGDGYVSQSGGIVDAPGEVRLGDSATTATGTYELSGGRLNAVSLVVGQVGTGEFTQSLGVVSVTHDVTLGMGYAAFGDYTLSGGRLSAETAVLGATGRARFVQTGGMVFVTGSVTLGKNYDGVGVYEVSGSGSLKANALVVGSSGFGELLQDGGTVTVETDMTVGAQSIGSGTCNMFAGALDVGRGIIDVGTAGIGTFNLHGGTVIADQLVVGQYGTFNFDGPDAVLRVNQLVGFGPEITFAGSLEFHHSGVFHVQNQVTVSDGEVLDVGRDLTVGVDVLGTFFQYGGVVQAGRTIHLGTADHPLGRGDYSLEGGSLSAEELHVVNGTFEWTDGEFHVRNITIDEQGTFTNLAHDLDVSRTVTVRGTLDMTGRELTVIEGPKGIPGCVRQYDGAVKAEAIHVAPTGSARYEWYGGRIMTSELSLGPGGVLAIGYNFLLERAWENDLIPGGVISLGSGVLEITNGAFAKVIPGYSPSLENVSVGSVRGAGMLGIQASTLSITGQLAFHPGSQGDGAALRYVVCGTDLVTGHGQIVNGGTAPNPVLGGTLVLDFRTYAYTPQNGDRFVLMTGFDGFQGEFDGIAISGMDESFGYAVHYSGGEMFLVVSNAGMPRDMVRTRLQIAANGFGGSSAYAGGIATKFAATTGGLIEVRYCRDAKDALDPVLPSMDGLDLAGSEKVQYWLVEYDGDFTGDVELTFGYDESLLGAGQTEERLCIQHFDEAMGRWELLETMGRNFQANTITVRTKGFSPFILTLSPVVPEPAAPFWLLGLAMLSLRRRRN